MPTYPKWVNAIAYRIIVAGIAVLCVAILTEGWRQWLEWSRNYYISQIYPRIKNSCAYVLAQNKLLSNAIGEQDYLLLQQIAITDISYLIDFGVPANFYPPKARDLLLSAERDLKGVVINNQDFAAKIFNGTIFLNPSEANAWLARGNGYLSNALQKIMAAQEMLGLSLEPP
jgi:hypothetical protein